MRYLFSWSSFPIIWPSTTASIPKDFEWIFLFQKSVSGNFSSVCVSWDVSGCLREETLQPQILYIFLLAAVTSVRLRRLAASVIDRIWLRFGEMLPVRNTTPSEQALLGGAAFRKKRQRRRRWHPRRRTFPCEQGSEIQSQASNINKIAASCSIRGKPSISPQADACCSYRMTVYLVFAASCGAVKFEIRSLLLTRIVLTRRCCLLSSRSEHPF